MRQIWMGIAPGAGATRVIGIAGGSETILKARLSLSPEHPRALPTLLEAIALWEGAQVRAALVADEKDDGSDTTLYRDAFPELRSPLYSLDWISAHARARRRTRDLDGVGDFRDLRQLWLLEGTR